MECPYLVTTLKQLSKCYRNSNCWHWCFDRLYTLEGKLIESGSELENGQFYVAVGRDKFKRLPYSELLFDKSAMRRPYG